MQKYIGEKMTYAGEDKCVRVQPEIPLCLNDFMMSIEEQAKIIEELASRLEPVFCKAKLCEERFGKEPPPAMSPLAARIRELNTMLSHNNSKLRLFLDNLAI